MSRASARLSTVSWQHHHFNLHLLHLVYENCTVQHKLLEGMHHHMSCLDRKPSLRSLISTPLNHQRQRNACTSAPGACEQFCLGCCLRWTSLALISQLGLKSFTAFLSGFAPLKLPRCCGTCINIIAQWILKKK